MAAEPSQIVLRGNAKLLRIVVDKRYANYSNVQLRKWTKRLIILNSSSFPVNAHLLHFPKDTKLSDALASSSSAGKELLDDTIIEVKIIPKSRKRNTLELMFAQHSLLMAFDSEVAFHRWGEEFNRIANYYSVMLTMGANRTLKQGDYVLALMPDKLVVYDAHTRTVSWEWMITHIQGFHHRRMTSEIELTVGSESSTGSGCYVFYGQRVQKFCEVLSRNARTLALQPLIQLSSDTCVSKLKSSSENNIPEKLDQLLPDTDMASVQRSSYSHGDEDRKDHPGSISVIDQSEGINDLDSPFGPGQDLLSPPPVVLIEDDDDDQEALLGNH